MLVNSIGIESTLMKPTEKLHIQVAVISSFRGSALRDATKPLMNLENTSGRKRKQRRKD